MAEHLPSDTLVQTDGKLRRSFVMFSNGEVPEVDRLAVILELMKEMAENERRAAIFYFADYYGYKVYPK